MDQPTVALIVGVVSAAITSLGWIVVHYLTRKREIESRNFIAQRETEQRKVSMAQADRTRRLEIRLSYYEKQIRELYAPLYSCIELIWNVWAIKKQFKKSFPRMTTLLLH
jgi:hypothetical protein